MFPPPMLAKTIFYDKTVSNQAKDAPPSPPRGIIHLAGESSVKGDGGHHWLVLVCVCFQIRPENGQLAQERTGSTASLNTIKNPTQIGGFPDWPFTVRAPFP